MENSYSLDSQSYEAVSTCDSNGYSKGKRIYLKKNPEKIRRWSNGECIKYEEFILEHYQCLNGSSSNRTNKIFLLMSQTIGTKTPTQCRSHHQKFFKRVLKRHLTKDVISNEEILKPRLNSVETNSSLNISSMSPIKLPLENTKEKVLNNIGKRNYQWNDFEFRILEDRKVDWEKVFSNATDGNFQNCGREEDFFSF